MGFLEGKRALIVGLASTRSIAWGIAQAFFREGAQLAFTYQNDKLKERVEKFAAECNSEVVLPCDVGSDEEITAVFDKLDNYWGHLDILIHSVAFAPLRRHGMVCRIKSGNDDGGYFPWPATLSPSRVK